MLFFFFSYWSIKEHSFLAFFLTAGNNWREIVEINIKKKKQCASEHLAPLDATQIN